MAREPEGARERLDSDRDETTRRVAELEREFAGIVASAAGGSSGGDDEHDPEGATVAFERQHIAALLDQARERRAVSERRRARLGAHDQHVLGGCERFFRPGYLNHLASEWIPALDGVEAKLTAGARVADVGCGHGASTLLLAGTYPASTVIGFDAHDGSIDSARKRAAGAGLADRVQFEVASAKTFTGTYDLVCLHDMGDPAGACAHVREHLAPDGTLMLIEPFAGDELTDNLNPVGATYYGFSTLLCTPSSLSQEVGAALGAQAGESRLREIVTGAGFGSLQRVAETPFNIVLEARA